jgi:heme-degrading monooxygenase HmoA
VYVIVWAFQARSGCLPQFEETYGPAGDWSRLFRGSPDYLGTELLRAADGSGRYLTVDRWRSAAAYESFLAARRDEYETLDRRCDDLTDAEDLIGAFEGPP